jgi:hypothetical protein
MFVYVADRENLRAIFLLIQSYITYCTKGNGRYDCLKDILQFRRLDAIPSKIITILMSIHTEKSEYREGGIIFYQVFLLSPFQCTKKM